MEAIDQLPDRILRSSAQPNGWLGRATTVSSGQATRQAAITPRQASVNLGRNPNNRRRAFRN